MRARDESTTDRDKRSAQMRSPHQSPKNRLLIAAEDRVSLIYGWPRRERRASRHGRPTTLRTLPTCPRVWSARKLRPDPTFSASVYAKVEEETVDGKVLSLRVDCHMVMQQTLFVARVCETHFRELHPTRNLKLDCKTVCKPGRITPKVVQNRERRETESERRRNRKQ